MFFSKCEYKYLFLFRNQKLTNMKLKNSFLLKVSFIVLCATLLFANISVYSQQLDGKNGINKVSKNLYSLNGIEINTKENTVRIPCSVNMDKGLIEVALCHSEGKVHESLLVTENTPIEIQTALLLIGLNPMNSIDEGSVLESEEISFDRLEIFLVVEAGGKNKENRLEYFIRDERTKEAMKPCDWSFRGASKGLDGNIVIDNGISVIATYQDPIALIELNSDDKQDDELFYVNSSFGLTKGQEVSLLIRKANN